MNTKLPTYLPYRSDFLEDVSQSKCIALIVAMDAEEAALLDGGRYELKTIGRKTTFHVKELETKQGKVLVARSGIGPVNAGILLTLLCETYPIDTVILLGVGGALDKRLRIGDTVVANRVCQHDSFISGEEGNLHIAPGELTLSVSTDQQTDPIMRCDKVLADWLWSVFNQDSRVENVYRGTVLSGSEFAGSLGRKLKLKEMDEDALLVDMEASALAQVARKLEIPFGVAKTVVDRLEPEKSIVEDYKNYLDSAARHSKLVIQALRDR